MKLRRKFTLITAAATVLPIAVGTLAVREWVQRDHQHRFSRLLDEGQQEVEQKYHQLQQQLQVATDQLVDPDDSFMGPVAIGVANADQQQLRRQRTVARRVMSGRGLDLLLIVTADGQIVVSGHFSWR